MTPQPPVYPPPANGFGGAEFPETLSDEEMRERAAAYAQMIYEQQLAAYKVQREQARALREAYERQWRAYRQAFFARQSATGQSVLQVDPDTGEQTAVPPPPPMPFAGTFPQASESVPAAESEPAPLPQQTAEESASAAPPSSGAESPGGFSESAFPQDAEAPQEIPEESVPAPDPEAVVFAETPPPEKFPPPLPPPSGFPWLSATAIALLAAGAAAVGYILFAGDPRFDSEREDLMSFFGKLTGSGSRGADAD